MTRVQQSGAALIVSLLMLLVMTLIGVTAMEGTVLEEKMAGNYRDRNLAFQATESALRDTERYISLSITGDSAFDASCTGGLCLPDETGTPVWESLDWSNTGKVLTYGIGGSDALAEVAEPPKAIIEAMNQPAPGQSLEGGSEFENHLFRITARGVGNTDSAVVMVQEVLRN